MNKLLSVITLASSAFVSSAFAANIDGGQLDISGLVSTNTCTLHVNGGAQDGLIILNTAEVADITDEVSDTQAGAKKEPFSILVDCSSASPSPGSTTQLSMGSVFFSNSKGTLNNDTSISQPATGVNIAIHKVDNSTGDISQVKINDPSAVQTGTLVNGKYTYNFLASYVKQSTLIAVGAGYVKTNAAYTVNYN